MDSGRLPTQQTWWQSVAVLHRRINREATINGRLYAAVVELRDLLNEWIEQMDDPRAQWRRRK